MKNYVLIHSSFFIPDSSFIMIKFSEIPQKIKGLVNFISEDVWRVTDFDISNTKKRGYDFVKIVSLVVRRISEDNLSSRAAALTYSTLLSLVPLLAVLLSIARGFGFNNIVESQLFDNFPGQREVLTRVFEFVNSYLDQSKEGLFVGLGIVILLYTVFNLISGIENNFNMVWQVKKGRSYHRMFTDYFSLLLLLPIFLVFSSGLSIFISTMLGTVDTYEILTPLYQVFLKLTPLFVTILAFTFLYMFMPNTKVRFKHAFYAGIFAGLAFLIFQYLYISGQIWVSKYNAIYGSFAFLPLLLLWLQLSWFICLIGAEFSFASQNIRTFNFEADSKNITRRYYDFVMLTVATLIIKRFEKGHPPYTADEISVNFKIPIRLTLRIVFDLQELDIINEVKENDDRQAYYQPALDINKITVGYLFQKIDTKGSEQFKIDKDIEFRSEWDAVLKTRESVMSASNEVLLKDL